jgi:hypothetical protein
VPGFGYYGGIVLNWEVGGLNPSAVDAAIMFGAKEVWMPNRHAGRGSSEVIKGDLYAGGLQPLWRERSSFLKREHKPINILTPEGELQEVLYEILDLIKEAAIILGTGHASREEAFALVKAAKSAGVKKILITHPSTDTRQPWFWPIEDMVKITDMGANLEFNATFLPNEEKTMTEAIKKVGADKCVMASGAGSYTLIHPIEAMRHAIRLMRNNGISERETDLMTKDKPAWLLGLE